MSWLTPQEKTRLELVAEKIKNGPQDMVYQIVGHADQQTGTKAGNKRVAEHRAKRVFDFLVSKGVNPKQLNYEGKGNSPDPFNRVQEGSGRQPCRDYPVIGSEAAGFPRSRKEKGAGLSCTFFCPDFRGCCFRGFACRGRELLGRRFTGVGRGFARGVRLPVFGSPDSEGTDSGACFRQLCFLRPGVRRPCI